MPGAARLPAFMLLAGLLAACASAAPDREPLADPGELAAAARDATDRRPAELRFRWDYADERGPLRGDGVARYNPPDSLRLDLFAAGDNSMSIALADGRLSSLGRIEDLRLPAPPFLYASAGIFRPATARPERGYRTDAGPVLVYRQGEALRRYRFGEDDRLMEIEEVRDGRVARRLTVDWPSAGEWPSGAEYRDVDENRRVRWEMTETAEADARHPVRIFDLPDGR